MAGTGGSLFQKALDGVERLPPEQQEDLAEVIQMRLAEQRCEEIACSLRKAKAEYRTGKVKRGGVNDLVKDFRS